MAATVTAHRPLPRRQDALTAIIDIGSNSIRLVVYRGLHRTPSLIFNEKVMAGLGRGVAANGHIDEEGMKLAESALTRFRALCADMRVDHVRAVATAAVREATNGDGFVERMCRSCGVDVEVISGEAEARYAALGVLAGIPDADGVVGDLGGGSLELIRVSGGRPRERISLPIGSLKLDAVRKRNVRALAGFIDKALKEVPWASDTRGKPFYMVGGSWRALAQVHMWLTDYPLPVVHGYEMAPGVAEHLVRRIGHIHPKTLRAVPNLSNSRVPSLPGAALLLRAVAKKLDSSVLVSSAYGLREGLLYDLLPPDEQRQDPLLVAAAEEGARQGRFPEHGAALMAWIGDLFADESPADERIRCAACLLSDVAWRAHPDFRAERGVDVALHGSWVAISARERAMLAAALFACFGGGASDPIIGYLHVLADAASLARARNWGLALRLGQRLTGGTAKALARGGVKRERGDLVLTLSRGQAALYGDPVARRHRTLAQALGLEAKFRVAG